MGIHPKGRSLAGRVLVAAPELTDPNFARSVVYLVEHNAGGALGLVVNRPTGRTLAEIVRDGAELLAPLRGLPVLQGGPVRATQLVLAAFERGESDHVIRGRVDQPPEELVRRVGVEGAWVRGFLGYAGWGEGQLERELAENAWRVRDPHPLLFREACLPNLWESFVDDDQRWRAFVSRLPRDPGLN